MSSSTKPQSGVATPAGPDIRPWYKEFYVWMVISGPVSVVIACIITAYFIMSGPDAIRSEEDYQVGRQISAEVEQAAPAMQPAKTGRNHSATGGEKN